MLPQRSEIHEAIVDLLRRRGNRLLSIGEIHERLQLAGVDAAPEEVADAADELEEDGIIMPVRGKRYSLLEFTPYVAGLIRVHPDGYGTLFGGKDQPDTYIDRRSMKGSMNGDLVVVRVDRRDPKYRKIHGRDLINGEVTRVLRRAHRT
ncbi:MAG: hypothetical protein ACXVIJ_11360, partial [Thermoanaerobaculia bacterium]